MKTNTNSRRSQVYETHSMRRPSTSSANTSNNADTPFTFTPVTTLTPTIPIKMAFNNKVHVEK